MTRNQSFFLTFGTEAIRYISARHLCNTYAEDVSSNTVYIKWCSGETARSVTFILSPAPRINKAIVLELIIIFKTIFSIRLLVDHLTRCVTLKAELMPSLLSPSYTGLMEFHTTEKEYFTFSKFELL